MRTRSIHFVVSGALGGLVGFGLMELLAPINGADGSTLGTITEKGFYFAGFGLAVGAALGMTEGFVQRKRFRLWYGLVVGLLLGAAGGFVGGALGQALYGLVPVRYTTLSNADLAIALDSSGSMRTLLFWGSDPSGKRKKAARELVERLSPSDRVAIVDFDHEARMVFPLTRLDSSHIRRAARAAIGRIDNVGGTNLSAGLGAAVEELLKHSREGREQHVIFLTDGQGDYDPAVIQPAVGTIQVHTVGLGSGVDAGLLTQIAERTGGRFYPVARAGDLVTVFERIFSENVDLTEHREQPREEAVQITNPVLLRVMRVLGWAIMGLVLGLGQGIRENTREDLRACALGGFLGGALGGALFDPVSQLSVVGGGIVGRGLADVIVGAAIGGTMRTVQTRLVETRSETTQFITILPSRENARPGGSIRRRVTVPAAGSTMETTSPPGAKAAGRRGPGG